MGWCPGQLVGDHPGPCQIMSAAFASAFHLNPAPGGVQQVWSCLSLTPNFPMLSHLTQSKIPSPYSSKYGLTWYTPFLLLGLYFLWLIVPILSIPGTQNSLLYLNHYKAGSSLRILFPGITLPLVLSLLVPPGLYSNATWNHQAIQSKGATPYPHWLHSS